MVFDITPTLYSGYERIGCFGCGMSFVVGEPIRGADRRIERSKCPQCKRFHWSVEISHGPVVCGVLEA